MTVKSGKMDIGCASYTYLRKLINTGMINEKEIVLESLLSMKRAGADIIISYHAKDVLKWL